ncbi:malate synthase A [Paenibacillus aceti]|uniref:Malate synthase n=1 Tax=Paenibacillus aceti TaxID=1820010 RepID=A0ABQ1VNH6_9BACL|nr:malate synthase A [Paenibacillus aceti]GGF84253.1 malate synthase [Paenibacillus aceti]
MNRVSQSNRELKGDFSSDAHRTILTTKALDFVTALERRFGKRRKELLQMRDERQQRLDAGEWPDFLAETAHVREGNWTVGSIPADLQDRRVEITGPSGDRKMVINALNSGAKVFMADFEDANSPTWSNTLEGQVNLRDAVNRTIQFVNEAGKTYELNDNPAVLIVRPRGWHMEEKHLLIDGEPVSASLFDFGLYFFHNAEALIRQGSGPYFYLPKMESHLEARLWNEVFAFAQEELGIPCGTIKATVLIETILAAFEMDEILFELRDHAAGLNCGRWDYIFSYIKKLRSKPDVILPDRAIVTMESPFMTAYSLLAIQTCHRRQAYCIGGMAAQIPIKNNPAANEAALEKVRKDKLREAQNGHDGTWVAHPGLVPIAMEVFDAHMPGPNQLEKLPEREITAADLLEVPQGSITEEGVRLNVSVGIQYLAAWLQGMGAVPINHLMEDVATAEISRAQLWQWIHHPRGVLDDGRRVTIKLFDRIFQEELENLRLHSVEGQDSRSRFALAASLFRNMTVADTFESFLTGPGYLHLSESTHFS